MTRPRVIGIDFGTSTTSVAYSVDRGDGSLETKVVNLSAKSPLLDTLIAKKDGKFVFGDEAKTITTSSLKAQLTLWDREASEKPFVFDYSEGTVDGLEAVTAFLQEVLRKARFSLKDETFGNKDDRFYICCPASWGPRARKLLFIAAEKAGIVLRSPANMIDEPVAAGWHVLLQLPPTDNRDERILIFDAGGGTVDVALLQSSTIKTAEAANRLITVINADARPESGNDVDIAFEDHMIRKGLDKKIVSQNGKLAKEKLTVEPSISQPFKASRSDLDEAYLPILEKQIQLIGKSFQRSLQTEEDLAAKVTDGDPTAITGALARSFRFSDIATSRESMKTAPQVFDRIFLTGGMAQIVSLQETIKSIFPGVPIKVVDEPQLAVCRGLTQIEDALWLNGSRLPISFRAKWDVTGMERPEVASRYPELDAWLCEQEAANLIPMHTDPWDQSGPNTFGLTDSVPGVFVELPIPSHLPNERHWEFQIEIIYLDQRNKSRTISSKGEGLANRVVKVSHQSRRPANIKLLAHRKLVVTGSNGERFVGDVRWQVGDNLNVEMQTLSAPSAPLPWPYLEKAASHVKDVGGRISG
jgi:actin-like ATPase involved in cell morphogenesis